MEYQWLEGKTPVPKPAREYCELLFDWIQECFDNTKIFPETFEGKTPKKFMDTVEKIFSRLFRVYAHMFYSHQQHLEQLELTEQVNLTFRHFYIFCREFNLLSKKDIEPLKQIIEPIDKEFDLQKLN